MKTSLCLLSAILIVLISCSKDDKKPDPVKPVAGFSSDATTIITRGKVNFTDTSTNNPTSWTWIFEGGNPGSSTAQNPVNIVYAAAGTYKVSLVATNSAGSSEPVEIQKYITVTPNPNSILPKTIKCTNPSNAENNYTATLLYDGNKIREILYDNGKRKVFTYTGNTITKVEKYKNNTIQSTTTLTYDNNKLKSFGDTTLKNDLTYNSDGTISVVTTKTYRGEETKSTGIITLDAKGNIVKMPSDFIAEYDTKNTPYKNILGYNALFTTFLYDDDVFSFVDIISVNNPTKQEIKGKKFLENNTYVADVLTIIFENTYDANNFLTRAVVKGSLDTEEESDRHTKIYEYTY